MNFISTNNGDHIPCWEPELKAGFVRDEDSLLLTRPGYIVKHNFNQWNQDSKEFQNIGFKLPKIPNDDRPALWWLIKLYPGQFQHMHYDPYLEETKNPIHYSVFLQDWKPGHIFTYQDKMLANYNAGDMYKWTDPFYYHGTANIGYETRYTLQITTYDP